MLLLKQTDPNLSSVIRNVGCFFRSSQVIAELICQNNLNAKQINEMWDWAKGKGYIDERNFMRASAPIINHAIKVLMGEESVNKKVFEVGTFKDGKLEYYKSVPPSMRHVDYLIQKIKTKYAAGTHFRVVDEKGHVIYDPDPRIESLGVFYSIIYCVVAS